MNILLSIFSFLYLLTLSSQFSWIQYRNIKSRHLKLKIIQENNRIRLNTNTQQRYRIKTRKEYYKHTNSAIPFYLVQNNRHPFEHLLTKLLKGENIDIQAFVQRLLDIYESTPQKIEKIEDLSKLDLKNTEYQKALYTLLKGNGPSVLKEYFTLKKTKINLLRAKEELFYTLFETHTAHYLLSLKNEALEKYNTYSSQETLQAFKKETLTLLNNSISSLQTRFSEKYAKDLCVFEFPPKK